MAQETFVGDEADPINPTDIRHSVDAIYDDDGALLQHYNFIVYTFTDGTAHAWARTYLDEADRVTIYGPFDAPGSTTRIDAPEFEQAVAGYLERRFPRVEFFDRRSENEGGDRPVSVARPSRDK